MQNYTPSSTVTEKATREYGVQDVLRSGLSSARSDLQPSHPLQHSEANFSANREAFLFQTLRDTQGLHAQLRLQMERKLTSRIQRLPPLESSNIAFNTLTGDDLLLPIESVLRDASDVPLSFDTHSAMEKKLLLK